MNGILLSYAEAKKANGGRPNSLCVEDQLLLLLGYYKKYNALYETGAEYGVSESTASRIVREVETVLIGSGKFSLAGKKDCLNTKHGHLLIDVTETPIERPKKKLVEEFAMFRKTFIQGRRKDIL
ncbi:MAG: transposase family protein [Bacteriovoracaceae bacterium]|nr:transposase family protein [Bacteriovoracaceae bacterium]